MRENPVFQDEAPVVGGDIGERLRHAAAFVPGDLPRLIDMGEAWALDAAGRLSNVAGETVAISFQGLDTAEGPRDGEDGVADKVAHDLHALLSSRRLATPGFVSLDARFLELLIANLFHAEPEPATTPARQASDLDRSLMALALEAAAAAGSAALCAIGDFDLATGELSDRRTVEEALGDAPVRYILFRFRLWARAGAGAETEAEAESAGMVFAIPDTVFAPHRRALSEKAALVLVDRDEAWSHAIEKSFARSDMRLEAILAKKKVPLETIARFHVGETIALGIDASSFLSVCCEDRQLFRARMGRSRESYVMRIEERVDPAEEFIDDILSD